MADTGSHHFVKGSHRDVLVPQPSDDPHDPLNWTTWWKAACITSAAMVTFAQGFGPLALAPMFPALMETFHCDLAGAVQFTGVCILVLGFSNFLWCVVASRGEYRWTHSADALAGSQSALLSAVDLCIFLASSSTLALVFGVLKLTHTARLWVHASSMASVLGQRRQSCLKLSPTYSSCMTVASGIPCIGLCTWSVLTHPNVRIY